MIQDAGHADGGVQVSREPGCQRFYGQVAPLPAHARHTLRERPPCGKLAARAVHVVDHAHTLSTRASYLIKALHRRNPCCCILLPDPRACTGMQHGKDKTRTEALRTASM